MIICEDCGEVIIGEMVEGPKGPIHLGGCPSKMSYSSQLEPFGKRVTVDRKTIDLSNQQMDAIQRLSKALWSVDQEMSPEAILAMWPTDTSELAISGPKPTKYRIETYVRTTAFIQDMASRGVRLDEMSQQLTSKQLALIQMMRNPEGRKLSVILKRGGVTQYVFDGWMKNPVFRKHITAMIGDSTSQALLLEIPLSQKAMEGDMNAIKFLWEWQDKYNPAKDNNAADATEFLRIVLGAVQEVVGSMPGGSDALVKIQKAIELKQIGMGMGRN